MIAFLADEHIPLESIRILREAGYDVRSVSIDCPSKKDREILSISEAENRIIITCDRDLGDLIFKRNIRIRSGVIYFRIASYRPHELAELILRFLTEPTFTYQGRLRVITKDRIRQRLI